MSECKTLRAKGQRNTRDYSRKGTVGLGVSAIQHFLWVDDRRTLSTHWHFSSLVFISHSFWFVLCLHVFLCLSVCLTLWSLCLSSSLYLPLSWFMSAVCCLFLCLYLSPSPSASLSIILSPFPTIPIVSLCLSLGFFLCLSVLEIFQSALTISSYPYHGLTTLSNISPLGVET